MTAPVTTSTASGGEDGREATKQEKPTRFQLGKDGPWVSAEPGRAEYLQGKGDSPVGPAESAPVNPDATVSGDEGAGAKLKTLDRPDRELNVTPVKRTPRSAK